jgi:putative SOS response-associated peptidase YedK
VCGRYTVKTAPSELASIFDVSELPAELYPRFNLAPTQLAPVITFDGPECLAPPELPAQKQLDLLC